MWNLNDHNYLPLFLMFEMQLSLYIDLYENVIMLLAKGLIKTSESESESLMLITNIAVFNKCVI